MDLINLGIEHRALPVEIDDMFLEFDDILNNDNARSSSVGDTSVRYLRWIDVPPEYIEVVKGSLQHELTEQQGQPVDRVELFIGIHVRSDQFVSQTVMNAHYHPILEGSQPLSRNEICDTVLGRQPGY
ncbi:CACTA en-spm transposon protein [Cucumis melo var. makuwa]|uniref:CACTA en-spm transposon protein n=1 Tax=Cucumis melo var. makuwa TaxID=1194695 RepID=A0A5D3BMQ6_CUCMM|nr:CACTA en-spm transposon protein [Cucumis melo var. makuwa]TYK00388.1 CACTA en-spm transposon protein [Cucumis melo var. makuwa]